LIKATVSPHFSFYQYSVECIDKSGKQIESRFQRADLFRSAFWDNPKYMGNVEKKEKDDWKRVIAFQGSSFFSSRPVPGLEADKLPLELGSNQRGDTIRCVNVEHFKAPDVLQGMPSTPPEGDIAFDSTRCANCTATFANHKLLLQHCKTTGHSPVYQETLAGATPAKVEVFLAYVNILLNTAFSERFQRWGRHFVDPTKGKEATGCFVYPAYDAEFSLAKLAGKVCLVLTLDLRAKVIRSESVADDLFKVYGDRLTVSQQNEARRKWIGEVVIYKNEKKCKLDGNDL
jgi:hypothetical protein